jgi:hypothetical protein
MNLQEDACQQAIWLSTFMVQQLMISFEHFSNKHDIEITSWGEVKHMVLTIMNSIYKYQIGHVTFKRW